MNIAHEEGLQARNSALGFIVLDNDLDTLPYDYIMYDDVPDTCERRPVTDFSNIACPRLFDEYPVCNAKLPFHSRKNDSSYHSGL